MRISGLLVLLLSGLFAAGVVSAGAQSQPASLPSNLPPAASSATNFDLLQKLSTGMAIDQYRLPRERRDDLAHFATNLQPGRDEVCYTMRSYKVSGKERFDDADHPMEYSTCQPASRFDIEKADEPAVLFP